MTVRLTRADAILQQRVSCGVLVLTASLQICFLDPEARRLINRMRPRGSAEPAEHWLPREIRCLGEDSSPCATRTRA